MNAKGYRLHIFAIFVAKSTLWIPLTFLKSRKPKVKISIFKSCFSFFFVTHNSKTIRCMQILYLPSDYSATGGSSFSGLWWWMTYAWQATATKRSPSTQDILILTLLWLLFIHSGHCTNSQATSRLLNTCVTGCNEFSSNKWCVSRSSTIIFFIHNYSVYLKTV